MPIEARQGDDLHDAVAAARQSDHLVLLKASDFLLDQAKGPLYLSDPATPGSLSWSVALIGPKCATSGAGAPLPNARIHTPSGWGDQPIVAAGKTRAVHVENIELVGDNSYALSSIDDIALDDDSLWGDRSYAPAIEIDGHEDAGSSSSVVLRNLVCRYTKGGISISDNGNKQNGDTITLEHISCLSTGRYALLFGGTQNKGVSVNNLFADAVQTVVETYNQVAGHHGFAQTFRGGTISRCQNVVNLGVSVGNFSWHGIHADSILSLGTFGRSISSTAMPVGFFGGSVNFWEPTTQLHADAHIIASRQVSLYGVGLTSNSLTGDFTMRVRNGRRVAFRDCHAGFYGHNDQITIDAHAPTAGDNAKVVFTDSQQMSDTGSGLNYLHGQLSAAELSLGTQTVTRTAGTDQATFTATGQGSNLQRGDLIRLDTPYSILTHPTGSLTYAGACAVVSSVSGDDITVRALARGAAAQLPFTGEVFRRRMSVS